MNYTYEEKKVIEKIYIIIKKCELKFKTLGYECDLYDEDEPIPVNEYKTLLNLIERQQKEIVKKDEQIKMLDEAYSGAIKESKRWFDIAKDSVPKDKIRCISNDIEYLWMGNLRYKDSQEVFELLLKKLKEILGD